MSKQRTLIGALLLALAAAGTIPAAAPPAPPEKAAEKKPAASPAGKAAEGKEAEGKEAPATRTIAEIEKDLKKAAVTQDQAAFSGYLREAAALGVPGYKLVITHALKGDNREMEVLGYRLLTAAADPAVKGLIYQEAGKNSNFKTRIILLGVTAAIHKKSKDPAAFKVLAGALRDPSRPVALTAVKWIRESGDKEQSVPALIEGLRAIEKGNHGRTWHDFQNALKALTGAENLSYATDWKNYWDSRASGKGAAKPSKGPTRAVRPADFFSVAIETDRLLFIIDVSGSMEKKDPPVEKDEDVGKVAAGKTTVLKPTTKGQKRKLSDAEREGLPLERQRMWRVKKELVKLIGQLDENVQFTVMSFSNEIHFAGDAPRLFQATPENKKKLQDWVHAMKPAGETWTDTAFEKALVGELKEVDTIFFLSDGEPWRDGKEIPDAQVLEGVKSLNRFVKARIHTFGFVQAGKNLRVFLQNLAAQNDGKYTGLE